MPSWKPAAITNNATENMNRRRFVFHSLLPLACAGKLLALHVPVGGYGSMPADLCFFDERFVAAQGMSGHNVGAGGVIAVRGDVTPFLNSLRQTVCQQTTTRLQGLTTESFYFCLHRSLLSGNRVNTNLNRVDRNLYAWSIDVIRQNNMGNS